MGESEFEITARDRTVVQVEGESNRADCRARTNRAFERQGT